MVGLAENVQACLRIFRRAQHQWLARDILHRAQGVFSGLCLAPSIGVTYPAAYCPPGRGFTMSSNPRALPPVTHGSALQAPERLWFFFLPRIMRIGRMSVLWRGSEQNINQKNPLERMEGCALMSCFRLGLIRASS